MGKEVADDAMDVENITPGDDKKASSSKTDASKSKTLPPPSVLELLLQGAAALDKAAATRDVRALPARALRLAAAARARVVTGADVLAFSREVLGSSSSSSSDALAEIVSALQQVRKRDMLGVLKPRGVLKGGARLPLEIGWRSGARGEREEEKKGGKVGKGIHGDRCARSASAVSSPALSTSFFRSPLLTPRPTQQHQAGEDTSAEPAPPHINGSCAVAPKKPAAADGSGDREGPAAASAPFSYAAPAGAPNPEVEVFASLVAATHLLDAGHPGEAAPLAVAAASRARAANRRTLDALAARVAAALSLAHERKGTLAEARPALLELHRAACARRDEPGQEALLNLLLRNYLGCGLVAQAEALRAAARRPDPPRSPQQFARYLFYLGRIRASRLEFPEAREALLQASRKAPAAPGAGAGFRLACAKWLTLVRLLLGDVPRLSELAEAGAGCGPCGGGKAPASAAAAAEKHPDEPFVSPDDGPLGAYVALARAVRAGDLQAFADAAAAGAEAFRLDETLPLVGRLRHAVIRAGLARASAAYARIPLALLAQRLGLSSAEDAEAVAAKAIADGSLSATIDHDGGFLEAGSGAGGYEGAGPRDALHARTAFCLEIHNEAVRALRYEPAGAAAAAAAAAETAEQARERARAEEEMARAIAEGEDDDEEDSMDDMI